MIKSLTAQVKSLETDKVKISEGSVKNYQSEISNKIKFLDHLCDKKDQEMLCGNLILSGGEIPTVKKGENVSKVACTILKKCLDLNLSPPDLLLAHRIGKPSDSGIDKRSIKIRVPHKYAKQTVMDACFALKSSTAKNLYINEELTKKRNSLYYRLRMKKKENPKICYFVLVTG